VLWDTGARRAARSVLPDDASSVTTLPSMRTELAGGVHPGPHQLKIGSAQLHDRGCHDVAAARPTRSQSSRVMSRTWDFVPPLSTEFGMPPTRHMVCAAPLGPEQVVFWNAPTVFPLGSSARYCRRLSHAPS
jgi:hypothetical protein